MKIEEVIFRDFFKMWILERKTELGQKMQGGEKLLLKIRELEPRA